MPSLAVLILHDLSRFSDILSAWHDAGAPAVTILDSVGTRDLKEQSRRDDLPLMPSIRDLVQADDAPRTTIFTVVPDEIVDKLADVTVELMGDLSEQGKGIFFVLPVSRVMGLRPAPHRPSP